MGIRTSTGRSITRLASGLHIERPSAQSGPMRRRSIRWPNTPSNAGNNVVAARSAEPITTRAPMPTERSIMMSNAVRLTRPMNEVMAENMIARPANV